MSCVRGANGKYDKAILDLYRVGYFKLNPKAGTATGKNGRPIGSVKRGAKGTTAYVKINLPVLEEAKNGKRSHWCPLHRVMAICFLGLPHGEKNTVNHKDGNGLNNKLSNLEWCSAKENTQHAIHVTGTFSQNGSKNQMALLTETQAREIMLSHLTDKELADIYHVGHKTIQTVRYGMHWKHLFEEVSKLPEFAKAARRRAHNSQLSRAGVTKKQAQSLVCSNLSIKDASAKFGVKIHTARRIRQDACWNWIRKSVKDKLAKSYSTGKIQSSKAQKIFKASGTTADIAETFDVSITCVQKIKARTTFTEATKGLKRG